MLEIFVTDRHTKAIAKRLQALHVQFLQRVGLVTRLACLARTVPLHGHRQNDGWAFHFLAGGRVGCIHLVRVVAAAIEVHDVLVAQIFHQFERLGILTKEVLSGVRTAIKLAVL
ncbi:MAG: Uncharacterised protein [Halieaceae bacterium]|nr:MAG: Uncharacterised protein [Halieaceae bacterium]